MKNILFILALTLGSISAFAQVPTITSFTPTSGPVGTTVTINGTNFNSTSANNIVLFGATKATVTGTGTTQLVVTVPVGATYQNISVTNIDAGLTSFSTQPFIPTFPCGGSFNSGSFANMTDYPAQDTRDISINDFNGDGKPDLAVLNIDGTVSIYKNTNTGGGVSFDSNINFPIGIPIGYGGAFAIGDLDSDGRPDIATVNESSDFLSVIRNTSTNGNISFGASFDYPAGFDPASISMADFDADGRLDIAISGRTSDAAAYSYSIFKNTSSNGIVSFDPRIEYIAGQMYGASTGDFDGDGKFDLAFTRSTGTSNVIDVYLNTTGSGAISFAARKSYLTAVNPIHVSSGDFDGDGKLDLAVLCSWGSPNSASNKVSVFRNTGAIGNISFAGRIDLSMETYSGELTNPQDIAVSDLDGDGRLDIVTADYYGSSSIFKNTSNGNISFDSKISFATGGQYNQGNPYGISVCDLDSDNRPDIATSHYSSGKVTILKNTIHVGPIMTSSNSTTICSGSATSISLTANLPSTYSWVATDNPNTTGESLTSQASSTLSDIITNNTTSAQTVTYTVTPTSISGSCIGTPQTVSITVKPLASLSNLATSPICSGSTFNYTAASIPGGATFLWNRAAMAGISQSSSSGTGNVSEQLTNTTSNPIDVVYAYTTTLNGCPKNENVIIQVKPIPTIITPNKTICSGQSTDLALTSDVSGATYSWIVQSRARVTGVTVGDAGTSNPIAHTLTSGPPQGTVVYRITPTANVCSGSYKDVTVTVNGPVTGGTIAGNQTICQGGDPVGFSQTTASTGYGTLSYQWQNAVPVDEVVTYNDIAGANISTYDAPAGVQLSTFYRRVTNSFQNGLSCSAPSNAIFVTVNNVTAGAVAADQTICGGGNPAAFTEVTPATGSGSLTYQWKSSTNGSTFTNIGGATSTVYDVEILTGLVQTTYYKRVGTSVLNGTTCSVDGNTLTVTVKPGPTTSSITGTSSLCINAVNVPYSVTNTPGSSYSWTIVGGTQTGGGNTNSITVTWGSGSNASVKVIETNPAFECPGIAIIKPITISTPVTITSFSGTAPVCPGNNYTYTANLSGGHQSGYTYQWTKPTNWTTNVINNNTASFYVPSNPNYGAVSVKVFNGACMSQDGMTAYPGSCGGGGRKRSDISQDDSGLFLENVTEPSVFPNPANSEIVVALPYLAELDLSIRVFSVMGNSFNSTIKKGTSYTKLNSDGLAAGLYIVQLETEDGLVTKKIVVAH